MRPSNPVLWRIALLVLVGLTGPDSNVPYATRIASMDYPRLGGMAQITGTVVLRLRIDSAGAIASVNALSGHPVLAKAAEQNIRLWRFSPARSAGQRVDAEFDFIYVFKLEGVTECPRPASSLIYEYPDKVTITSEAPHMQP